jgi:hypothetical protein
MSLNLILEGFVAPNGQGNFNFRGLNDGASVNFILNMLSHLSTGGTTITGTVKGTTGGGGGSGGSGTDFVENIIQTAHGLLVGNVVRLSGAGTYTKAQANNAVNAEVVGIVVAVIDANTFTICYGGYIDPTLLVFTGLTPNSVYFLSPITPGALTLTEPITPGQVSKPLIWADYPNSGYFFNMRGLTVSAASVPRKYPFTFSDSTQSSKYDATTKLALGSKYFDPNDASWGLGSASIVKLCMLLETTNGANLVGGDLLRETGAGSPVIIASTPTTAGLNATLVTVDVSTAFRPGAVAGIFTTRCWITTAGDQVTNRGSWLEIQP